MTATSGDYVFSPFAPGFVDDPYPHYEQLGNAVEELLRYDTPVALPASVR